MIENEIINRYLDFSGGLQTATTRLLMKDNELSRAVNARYEKKIGGVARRDGCEPVSMGTVGSSGYKVTGGHSYFTKDGRFKILASNDGASTTEIRYLSTNNYWTSAGSISATGIMTEFVSFLDLDFIVGQNPDSGLFMNTRTIDGDMTILSSSTVTNPNVSGAPKAKYIAKYGEKLYLANCQVGGINYPNRVYVSSAPTDAITYVNGDQKVNNCLQLSVDSTRYLKAGMKVDIYGENSNQKKIDSLEIISVDKANEKITFSATNIDVLDRDEIYFEDRKGKLTVLWNTDYPNAESSDFIEIPAESNEIPEIIGLFVHNNRLFIFTEHSRYKWDGANLVKVSSTIGTTSQRSIAEVNGYMVFANKFGIWGVNDSSGQEILLSRQIQNYIDAVNQVNWYTAVGVARNNIYKLFVGTMGTVDSRTTSTSTSSTSTSSTSSSTSSTSTSSTSTSSTSSSTSSTTKSTSTSSTSRSTSTSSTSLSTSSTSISTSTSSTTVPEGTSSYYAFVYDFSMNNWSVDQMDRQIATAFTHTMHGFEKIYFGDTTGRVFRDETGLTDNTRPIPFLVETKRFHMNLPEETKKFRKAYIYTQNGQWANVQISIDGGEWKSYGQLEKNLTCIKLGDIAGRDIAFRVTQNTGGEPVVFIGISVVWLRGELYD